MFEHYRKRVVIVTIIVMLMFAFVFFLSLRALGKQDGLFDIGVPYMFEDYLIMFLSIVGIIKSVVELYKAEHVNKRDPPRSQKAKTI